MKINSKQVSGAINVTERDFYQTITDEKNSGLPSNVTLGGFISMCSSALNRQILQH